MSEELHFVLVEPTPGREVAEDYEIYVSDTGVADQICWISPFRNRASEIAHLIAAAPELYEALEMAHNVLRLLEPERAFPHIEAKAWAALQKARGEG